MKQINGVDVYDTLDELVDRAYTALLVVDVQNDFCHPNGHFARHGKKIDAIAGTLPKLVSFVRKAQDMGVFTVFIQQLTLPHGRSDSPAWLRLKCRDGKSPEYTLQGSWGAELIEGLNPTESDVVMPKFRPDAFVRSALDGILRAQGIRTLVVVGTTTEGCVESTVRGGSYHDYYIVPVSDLISSPNPELHENSMAFMKARYPVASSDQVLQSWQAAIAA